MSFTKDKVENIKKYILEKIFDGQDGVAKRTAESFGISLNTAYRYIRDLEKSNIIKKKEESNRQYELVTVEDSFILRTDSNKKLEEDIVYDDYIKKYIENLPENIQRIWQYSFMEMMNNAIDHSGAKFISCVVIQNYMNTTILIGDNGIGIFQKIKKYYELESLDDAVNELFKGKLTTDTKNHSGEGIFFTSRILDTFAVFSDGKIFTHDKYQDMLHDVKEIEPLKEWKDREGTYILMQLSNFSHKILKEVFDMFSDNDGGFIRTSIPIKNIFETYPVSRSQAKRLCNRFENFKEVELDFQGINEIGQGFAHEIFVVFQNNHKDITLLPVNMEKDVEKMINHVKRI